MPIDQELLNNSAAKACELLAGLLPRHIAGMTWEARNGHGEITLENPNGSDHHVRIGTADCEVTLEFGECHIHFHDSNGSWNEAELVGETVVKVVAIVGGFEASYSAWAGESCLGGGWLPVGGDGREPFGHFHEADRLRVVAWEPWNDREILRDPAE